MVRFCFDLTNRKVIKQYYLNILFTHKGMFTNWLNNTYIILIISLLTSAGNIVLVRTTILRTTILFFFLTLVFLSWARSLFILKLPPGILPSMLLTSNLCLGCLLLLWLGGPGLLAAVATLAACLTSVVCYYSRYHFPSCYLFYFLQ